MKKERSINDMQCSIAEMVHEKYQKELYSLSACHSDYDHGLIEELRLQIGLRQSGICCPERKEKIHAAISIPNTGATTVQYSTGGVVVFQFVQPTPAGTWIIAHNLGYNPPVVAYDNNGNPIPGSIVYLDKDTLQIIFTYLVSGRANLYN